MTEDKNVEHPHDYDGIVELDNDLPRWWTGIFWVTIVFGIFYVVYFHIMKPEKLPVNHYNMTMSAMAAEREAADNQAVPVADLDTELLSRYQAGGWQAAKAEFITYCVACHAADGGGGIGPNFTDDYTIHGGRLSDMVRVITEGVPEKGMVSWKAVLKPDQIADLACLIKSLRGTTPATSKAAEGRLVDADGAFVTQ